MKKLLSIIIVCLPIFIGAQSEAPLITNVLNRSSLSLDGKWHYIIDPYESGFYNYRREPFDKSLNPGGNAYFTNTKALKKTDRVEYNFSQAPTLLVPGSWNVQADQLLYYEGSVWYQRDFSFKRKNDKRIFLYFGAANYETHVYLNGQKVGKHIGGFTPFNFEVTEFLEDGDNFIVVKVDNTRYKEAVPTINTDWWNHGGITRSVELVEVPQNFIQDYKIQLKKGTSNEINGFVKLNAINSAAQEIQISIPELDIQEKVNTDQNGWAQVSIKVDQLELWEPENPKLYDVELSSGADKLKDRIGFRSISTQGKDILLNGEKIFLRGICMHEENPMMGRRNYSEADALLMLNWVKELHGNFIRLAHYPHNEQVARKADEMGIFLWEEVPVYWTIQWENEATLANAQAQLTKLIKRDQNRASVIVWSMANETPVSEARNTFLKALVDTSRSLDNTRLISAALEVHSKGMEKVLDDPFGQYTDIVSFNQYHGWYGGDIEEFKNLKWTIKYDKPVVVSEWGAGALYGMHGDKQTVWSEEFQANLYEKTLEGMDNIPGLAGFTPWLLADFRSPRRNLSIIQDGWNRKGIISEGGQKKQAFYVLQSFYKSLKK